MFRLKLLAVLAGIITTLAISAAPAFAEFEANSHAEKESTGEGAVTVLQSGEFVDEGSTVKCPAGGISVRFYIQTKGKILEHEINGKQLKSKKGPHLDWIIKWGTGCIATIGGNQLKAKITEGCRLQILFVGSIGSSKEVELNGGSGNECVIKAGPCEIKVPAANESTGENLNLGTTIASNNGFNQIEKSNTKGITTVKTGTLCTLKNNKTSELKGVEFENVGENLV